MNDRKRAPSEEDIYKLVKDNNRMLHSMRRNAFISSIFKIVFWIVILVVLPYLSWLFIQPYLDAATGAYQEVQGSVNTLNNAASDIEEAKNSFPDFGDLLNQFGGGS